MNRSGRRYCPGWCDGLQSLSARCRPRSHDPAAFVSDRRPAEEFYDLEQDPHEVRNLVGDPRYVAELQQHRDILKRWIKDTDDKGQYPESDEGLFQVLCRWGDKCVNPEYEAVRRKYADVLAE